MARELVPGRSDAPAGSEIPAAGAGGPDGRDAGRDPRDPQGLRRDIDALAPWFHNLVLGGVSTAPDHFLGDYPRLKWRTFAGAIPRDLTGKTVLDIGCNAGFYSMEMKRRGAARVVGIDADPRYLAQARLATQVEGVDVELAQLDVYRVADLGQRFDVVLFLGVLYHLRYPLYALDLLAEHVVGDLLVVQSLLRGSQVVADVRPNYPFEARSHFDADGYPRLSFVEHCYAGDPTNWWIPNRAGLEAMLRSAGFDIAEQPADDVYLCRPRAHRGTAR